ncbi:ARM REPEAT PROTEIN INTERACTING WITH ABF2 [Trifolium repens]|nr:ARM REPEAT PROTEIN INTERACTING WITH ABF2 [Trifolium repens]
MGILEISNCNRTNNDSLELSVNILSNVLQCVMQEKEAKDIEIPNIKWNVFELMMRFMCTGTVDVDSDVAVDLLKAADQYLLDSLKRISKDISVENVSLMYAMAETSNATSLRYSCILFVLNHFDSLSSKPWYDYLTF